MLDPRQQVLCDAWCRLAREHGGLPPRRCFDPIDFPQALSSLILTELLPNGALYYRLVGSDMVAAWGADFTGRHLHDIMEGEYHTFIRGLFDEAITKRLPIFSHSRFQWHRGRSLDTKRLFLPFARNDAPQEVGYVLVSQVFDYAKTGPTEPLLRSLQNSEMIEIERQPIRVAGS
jgi:hypothetical protein